MKVKELKVYNKLISKIQGDNKVLNYRYIKVKKSTYKVRCLHKKMSMEDLLKY